MSNKQYPRSDRIADQLQRELAQLIRVEIKDPRLDKTASISDVRVTQDLRQARIYVTTLNQDPLPSIDVLNHASGFLRQRLGKLLTIRAVPQLTFVHDTLIAEASQLSQLIDQAVAGHKTE